MEGYEIYELLCSSPKGPICQDDINQISQKRTLNSTVASQSEFHTIADTTNFLGPNIPQVPVKYV